VTSTPEIARSVKTGRFATNVHDLGTGAPVVLIHGSGPGVTAWANWRLALPDLSHSFRVIAPDMVGFGYSDRPAHFEYGKDAWVRQAVDLLDALDIEKAHFVGNSFGGAISLALALRHPERVDKIVLMGAAGVKWPVTDGLAAVWGYEPSIEAMRNLLDIFAFDRTLVTDELAKLRYEASVRPGFHESFKALFPKPYQQRLDALASDETELATLPNETLIFHGREDRVVPLESSIRLHKLIARSQLHVFGQCGHWTQIERTGDYNRLTHGFLQGNAGNS
jgi:2-hydroxymuconate-semialdehyde hydrolase